MKKVITYGTYDLLHYGHIKLLERAKALGDYLIVGITSDDFDRSRGKINVSQPLMERIEAVRNTGLADEIIVEEYEGQKIDDIKRHGVDIFTVGSDWQGKFDYLNEFCEVIYLDRTQGVSSTKLRSENNGVRLGVIGMSHVVEKLRRECEYVNGLEVTSQVHTPDKSFFDKVDAVYIVSHPSQHYAHCKGALKWGKHILCESPLAMNAEEVNELYDMAEEKGLVLMDAIKTAYSTAFSRLILLAKSGKIGELVSVDATCTSLKSLNSNDEEALSKEWNSLTSWGPTSLLPIFSLFGTEWNECSVYSRIINEKLRFDDFSKIAFQYPRGVASAKVGKGVKSEGELIISGTQGYIYVPAPWWKTDYFELRFENPNDNRRCFYQLEGEGIRNELVSFVKQIGGERYSVIPRQMSCAFAKIFEIQVKTLLTKQE